MYTRTFWNSREYHEYPVLAALLNHPTKQSISLNTPFSISKPLLILNFISKEYIDPTFTTMHVSKTLIVGFLKKIKRPS